MKVDYKNYPILEKLEKNSLGEIPIFEQDKYFFTHNDNFGGKLLQECFKKNCHKFKKITYLSESFVEASGKAYEKLGKLYQDIVSNDSNDIDIEGTFIFNNTVFFLKHSIKKEIKYHNTIFYAFRKNGTPIMFHVNGQDDIDGFYYWVSNVYEDDLKAINMSIDSLILSKITHLILISMFQSYASVETKYIAPKSKSIQGIKSYKNGTNLGITYLTSKWFTNLVRSEGFSVRGHFRLQPKKVNGEWSKELIWIDTFEKTGYTSSAQILKHDKSSKQSI